MKSAVLLIVLILSIITQLNGQNMPLRLLGNDFGLESMILQDNLIEKTRYRSKSFSPLNISYFSFGRKSMFNSVLSYHQRIGSSHSNSIETDTYNIVVSYLRSLLDKKYLKFYVGFGNHTYFTLVDFRGLQTSYDMGIINLRLQSLVEFNFKSHQLLLETGYGIIKYGSRSGYDWILGIDSKFTQKWTSFAQYNEAYIQLRLNFQLIERIYLSPTWLLYISRNTEYQTMATLLNQYSLGVYLKI